MTSRVIAESGSGLADLDPNPMTTYAITLFLHSYLRWVLLALLLVVLVRAFLGWRSKREWTGRDERMHVVLVALVDTQLLLGLLLYLFLSPISKAFFTDTAVAMKDHVLRFYGMEHVTMMVLAVAVIHVGRARSKKSPTAALRHRRVWTSILVSVLFIASSIPWPFLRHGRPLFREWTAQSSIALPAGPEASTAPQIFASRCAPCHGTLGRGDGIAAASLHPSPRNFAAPNWGNDRTDADLYAVIHDGGAKAGLSAAMPSNADMSREDIVALVDYIRRLHRELPSPD